MFLVSDQGSTSAEPNEISKKDDRRHTLLVAFLAGALGILGTFLGTVIQMISTDRAQDSSYSEERAREDRQHKSEAYFGLLKAAEHLWFVTHEVDDCLNRKEPGQLDAYALMPLAICGYLKESFDSAEVGYQEMRDKVFVYGSAEADRAAASLTESFPNFFPMTGGPADPFRMPIDYDENRQEFIRVVCREVPGNPRQSC